MKNHKVAVIRGDGIGIEVVEEGLKVLKEVSTGHGFQIDFEEFPWGSDYYKETGVMMPSDGIDSLIEFDAIFLGEFIKFKALKVALIILCGFDVPTDFATTS